MENRLSILEPIVVCVTCVDGSHIIYDDYYYCGNGLLCYFNSDHYKDPKNTNIYECSPKFSDKYGPTYYIPHKLWTNSETLKSFCSRYNLDDFNINKIIDNDTFETSPLNKEGYIWYNILKQQTKRYLNT